MIHRADIHLSILQAVKNHPLIQFRTNTRVCELNQNAGGVTVIDEMANGTTGMLWSVAMA